MIRVKDAIIALIPILKLFGNTNEIATEDAGLIIILEMDQRFKAIQVRSVVERREIVVKSLGSEFNQLDFVAGASILGDGKVSLILDIENLFKIDEALYGSNLSIGGQV